MTTLQIQALLTYLGYDPGEVDGLPGRNTRRAVLAFQAQEGLETDGSPGPITQAALLDAVAKGRFREEDAPTPDGSTGTWWDNIRYWTREEFRCRCGEYHAPYCNGFPVEPDQTLVELADDVREHFGRPGIRSSGIRCKQHNADQTNSAVNSRHLYGKALDFRIQGKTSGEVLAYIQTRPGVHYAYAIDDSYVHMDVD